MTYNDVLASINTNLASGAQIPANLHRVVAQAILDFTESRWLPGDVKKIDCTDQYISQNFDSNGIGINERLGWAICNGYNGLTRNRTGRVSVAYGITPLGAAGLASPQPSVGAALNTPVIGGQKDAVVVAHTHTLKANVNKAGGPAGGGAGADDTKQLLANDSDSISTTGVPGTDKNMQPYIVTLFIQKL
jgi:hypothetical protein